MRLKNMRFYCVTSLALAIFFFGVLPPAPTQTARADWFEECLHEGCSGHEVDELCWSYQEECNNEGCDHEEVIELAGTPLHIPQLHAALKARGCNLDINDFANPIFCETDAFCVAAVLVCRTTCRFPSETNVGTEACGVCLGCSW